MSLPSSRGKSSSFYERWVDVYEQAYRNPGNLDSVVCPHCGRLALNLIFIVDVPGETRSTFVFWCAACLGGLPPNRTRTPLHALPVFRGTEHVPNYELVVDEPGAS